MKSPILSAAVLVVACAWPAVAQEKPKAGAPGTVTLPLAEYDRLRSTALLSTLEEFLRRRGSISATAEALYVHPNTLRQRLRRIMELSGIDLRKDDWLMVEIAVKLVKLQQVLDPLAVSRS